MNRKEKTHQKIVLGAEVAKYMGLEIDIDLLVGFLNSFASLNEEQKLRLISNGARIREIEKLKKSSHNKYSNKNSNSSFNSRHGGVINKLKYNNGE